MKIFNLMCHRKPERSFFIKNHQFPVCARCTGFYSALFIFILYDFFYTFNTSLELFLLGIIFLIPVLIDGFTQYFGLRESNNILRFVTGIIGGFGLIFVLFYIIKFFFNLFAIYL